MLLGILLGACLVLLVFVGMEIAVALKRRFRRKDYYLPDKKKQLLTYIELSRHNNQDQVDKLFGLRRW